MIQTSSPFAGLVGVVVVLVVIGSVLGLAISGTDLPNFITRPAEVERIRSETQIEADKGKIDVQNYGKIEEARTQAEVQRIQAEAENYRLQLDQDREIQRQRSEMELELARIASMVFYFALAGTIVAVGIAGAITVTRIGKKFPTVETKAALTDRWNDRQWRQRQIRRAKQTEHYCRTTAQRFEGYTADDAPIPWSEIQHSNSITR